MDGQGGRRPGFLSLKYLTKINSISGALSITVRPVKQMLPQNLEHEQLSSDADAQARRARSLGAILRSAREARAMTVREVSQRIRIPATYLTMLEANDYGAIADELYLLPFVRSYADFLGLEAGVLSDRFLRGIQPVERPVDQAPEPVEARSAGHSRWFTTAAVMLFVALALYLVGLK